MKSFSWFLLMISYIRCIIYYSKVLFYFFSRYRMKLYELKLLSQSLQSAFLSLQSGDEMFCFLRDLMTEAEIVDFSQRLDIAKRLYHNESYKQIEDVTGVSSTTIARVGKFLNGEYWWYKMVLERMKG